MSMVIDLASRRAAPTTPPASLAIIQLHAQAHNALSTALHFLGQPDCTAQQLQTATARAVRAATLLLVLAGENPEVPFPRTMPKLALDRDLAGCRIGWLFGLDLLEFQFELLRSLDLLFKRE